MASGKVKGTVVSVTDDHRLVTDIPVDALTDAPTDESVTVASGGHKTCCLFPAEHGQAEMTFLAMLGSSGFLELTLVGDDAVLFLGINIGTPVVVRW